MSDKKKQRQGEVHVGELGKHDGRSAKHVDPYELPDDDTGEIEVSQEGPDGFPD